MAAAEAKKKPNLALGWVTLGIIVLFVLALAFGNSGSSSGSSNSGNGYGARDACRSWVKDQLKAPATAQFSGETGYSSDTGPWEIVGNVDAQNGFGALIRNIYTCSVHTDGDYYRGSATLLDR